MRPLPAARNRTRTRSLASRLSGVLLCTAPAAAQAPFEPPRFLTPPEVTALASTVADLDGDGLLDLVAQTAGPSGALGLAVARGTAPGVFANPVPATGGDAPRKPVVGDFDGDGHPDVAAAGGTSATPRLLWYRGDGAGGLAFAASVALPAPALEVAVADLDGDGTADLLALTLDGTLLRLAGGPGGPGAPLDTGLDAVAFTVVDVDGDGLLDIALRERTPSGAAGGVQVARATGPATFAPPVTVLGGPGAQPRVFALDANGDGHADLAAFGPTGARLLLGDGSGAFSAGPLLSNNAAAVDIAFADLDGDGLADLLYREAGAQAASRWSAAGTAPFALGASTSLTVQAQTPLVDVDGDGRADALFGTSARRNVGPGAPDVFGDLTELVFQAAPVSTAALVDLDRDGDLDVLACGTRPRSLGVHVNLGALDLVGPREVALGQRPVVDARAGVFGGGVFGGEGIALVRASASGTSLEILRLGDGTLVETTQLFAQPLPQTRITHTIDLDGDGSDEIVVQSLSTSRAIRVGPGGAFASSVHVATSQEPVAFADLDDDGDLDVIYTEFGAGRFARNDGGTFTPNASFLVGANVRAVAAGDIDGDGRADLVVAEGLSLRVLLRTGPFTFAPPRLWSGASQGNERVALTVLDVDGDGALDVVVARLGAALGARCTAYLGDGEGAVQGSLVIVADEDLEEAPRFGDLDGDGDPDALLVLGTGSPRAAIAVNRAVRSIGANFCGPAAPNSIGRSGTLRAYGSGAASAESVLLVASSLPPGVFGLLLGSAAPLAPTPVSGTEGRLCLDGSIGRYDLPGEIGLAAANGSFSLAIDPGALRAGSATVAALSGGTWCFQAWHRDVAAGGGTSNFTDGLLVTWE